MQFAVLCRKQFDRDNNLKFLHFKVELKHKSAH